MVTFTWSEAKNGLLRRERGVCFEQVVAALEQGTLLDVLEHHAPDRYPGQRIFVVDLGGYAHLVPFVEGEDQVFLKTIIPSREHTRRYLGAPEDDHG